MAKPQNIDALIAIASAELDRRIILARKRIDSLDLVKYCVRFAQEIGPYSGTIEENRKWFFDVSGRNGAYTFTFTIERKVHNKTCESPIEPVRIFQFTTVPNEHESGAHVLAEINVFIDDPMLPAFTSAIDIIKEKKEIDDKRARLQRLTALCENFQLDAPA